jgi:hypothetical protein
MSADLQRPVRLSLLLPNDSAVSAAPTTDDVGENGPKVVVLPHGVQGDVEKAPDVEAPSEPAAPPRPPMPSFPEGGREAWTVVAGGWIILFCTWGFINGTADIRRTGCLLIVLSRFWRLPRILRDPPAVAQIAVRYQLDRESPDRDDVLGWNNLRSTFRPRLLQNSVRAMFVLCSEPSLTKFASLTTGSILSVVG